ncbi:hypothetical protein CBS147346_3302 [Aspergillus niger]|nr:hypothetical protein CBS147346_3302 [Aspergillus niger]
MSLGAGVGDILACASLAYKIYQELSEMNGVSEEYQALTSKLLIVHKLLLQVEKLRASNQLAQSTLNAIRFLTSRMGEAIGEFSTKLEKDSRASQAGEYGIALKNIFSKGKSSLAMTYEVSLSEVEELTANEYNLPTWGMDAWVGAITLRRFVVVQQGTKSCLCLGIHTYSGRGCSDQPDQELFAILHSLKHIPDPLPEETRMGIQPLRLKPEHPSTVLPSTARIHFGRVYEIKHDVELKNIGLIHSSSMDILSSQFESHCPIDTPNGLGASQDKDQVGTSADDTVTQAGVRI